MTEVIREVDSSNNGLLAVILIVVIAIGGFLVWRFSAKEQPQEPGGIDIQLTAPAGSDTDGRAAE